MLNSNKCMLLRIHSQVFRKSLNLDTFLTMIGLPRKSAGNRKFYSLPEEYPLRGARSRLANTTRKSEDVNKIIKYIDENIIGKHATFYGPYGRRKVVYCDYTASARSLQFIEDYILKEVLPCYGNTHTETSITSLQSSLYRHEARDIFRNAVNASEHDAVIFTGHGCTGAVHKLIHALNFTNPPVVFVGPWEHHSNLLPWREIGAKIVRIAESRDGLLDYSDLENQLQLHQGEGKQLIGCFSAASNITGILADDIKTTLLLHQYGALAFWDYATAAPYVKLDMNPFVTGVSEKAACKDAMYFSVHKFVGGVQTPGVLIAKKSLFKNSIPNGSGGGSVFFVSREDHRYLQDVEMREEGGTAAIVESVRAGLVMQLKETVTVPAIMAREEKICSTVLSHVKTIPELMLLGNGSPSVKRLPVFSFVVLHPRGTFLHHNFVCAVLNDVFGIQARGGCACAGPYAQDLLGIDEELAQKYESVLLEDRRLDRTHLRRQEEHSSYEMLRPGFARISLPYFMSDGELAFVLEALKMVATEGWKLLPQYVVNPETGEWRHHTNSVFRDRKWLGSIRYVDGKMTVNERRVSGQGTFPQDYADSLHTARNIFNKARKMAQRFPLADQCVLFDDYTNHLRWFMLPSEAQDLLLGKSHKVKQDVPFSPPKFCGARGSVACNSAVTPEPITPENHEISPELSDLTRHNSLPCVSTQSQQICVTPTLPLFAMIQSQPNLVSPGNHIVSPLSPQLNSPPNSLPVNFFDSSPPKLSSDNLTRVRKQAFIGRTRCYSLGSMNIAPEISKIRDSENLAKKMDTDNNASLLNHHFISILPNINFVEEYSEPEAVPRKISQQTASLHAYVKEMTQELATEIKSEIRDVISKVEDVLSESENSSHQSNTSLDKVNAVCNDSVSANEVAEYLMEMSKEVASEMKSEIREVVTAVDVLMSPDIKSHVNLNEDPFASSPDHSDTDTLSEEYSNSKSVEDEIPQPSNSCHENGDLSTIKEKLQLRNGREAEEEEERRQDSSFENRSYLRSTINSVSSQDSGINLTFQDTDSSTSQSSGSKYESKKFAVCCPRPRSMSFDTFQKKELLVRQQSENIVKTGTDMEEDLRKLKISDIKNPGVKWHCPPKAIWKPTMEALKDFDMIRDGDRVMVCLSGGKDSLSLLHTLHQYQHYAKAKGVNFSLGAATVDPKSSAYDPSPLIPYLKELGVHYLYEEQAILQKALDMENCTSICSFCSRLKRGRLYSAARTNNYNVLALGQHLDDISESFLMSVFHNGRLRTMKAHYYVSERDLRVIRPFVYVREKDLRQFAESKGLPVIRENCPACFEMPKERHRTKQLLAQQEILFPRVYSSLRSALRPLISFHYTGEESKPYMRRKKCSSQSEHGAAASSESEEEPVN